MPDTGKHWRKSLKTSNLQVAQQKRDVLLSKLGELTEKVSEAKTVLELRKEYLSEESDEKREVLKDIYLEQADEMALALGLYELYHLPEQATKPEDLWTDEERKPQDFYKIATARLHPFTLIRDPWLADVPNPRTRDDFRRALDVLMESFDNVEQVTYEKAEMFLRNVGKRKGVSTPTVRKWQTAYINLWSWCGVKTGVWRLHRIPKTGEKLKVLSFTGEEVVMMYKTLCERNDVTSGWLKHAVWIAAHCGRRQGAIENLTYYPDDETIRFPKMKKEEEDSIVPAHPAIRQNLIEWGDINIKAVTISKRFTEFKQELGFGPAKRFHSFRHTFLTQLKNLEVPELIASSLVTHKIKTMSYGVYGDEGVPLSHMRREIIKLDYGYHP